MIKPERIAALVPMRHHSQRVVGKNYRLLAGKPLYYHILESLQACPEIQTIVVDTDSPVIKAGLQQDFPEVVIIDRPAHLLADTIPMNEILLHDTSQVAADLYLQTHSTNPLLKPETISAAIRRLVENYPSYDSLFLSQKFKPACMTSWDDRSITTRQFCFAPRICRPSTKKTRACIFLIGRPLRCAATAWARGRTCSRSVPMKPGILTMNSISWWQTC